MPHMDELGQADAIPAGDFKVKHEESAWAGFLRSHDFRTSINQ